MKTPITLSAIVLAMSLCSPELKAQRLFFHSQPVDTIIIKSEYGVYQFDEKGTTKGELDYFVLAFDPVHQSYFIKQYDRDKFSASMKTQELKIKTKKFQSEIGKKVESEKLKLLLNALSQEEINSPLISQVDTNKIKSLLTEATVKEIAKWFKIDWRFKKKYATKEENASFFKHCTSIDSFKLYLLKRFDTSGYAMVTDYSNTFGIRIKTNNAKYRFEGKYPNPVKQPWYYHKTNSIIESEMIVNLNINKYLCELLPEKFLLKETISEEALVNDYIKWYFERRRLIM